MDNHALDVRFSVHVRGMWRAVLLGWAIRLFRLGKQHVEVELKA